MRGVGESDKGRTDRMDARVGWSGVDARRGDAQKSPRCQRWESQSMLLRS